MGTFLAKLGIAAKITAAIGVLTVAAVTVALVGIDALRDYNARVLELNRLSDRAIVAGRINGLILTVVMESRGIYMSRDRAEVERFARPLMAGLAQLGKEVDALERTSAPAERAETAGVAGAARDFIRFRTDMTNAGLERGAPVAREIGDNDTNRANRQALNDAAVALVQNSDRRMESLTAETQEFYSNRLQWLLAIAAIGILAGVGLATAVVVLLVTRPLNGLTRQMSALAAGDLATVVGYTERTDEIGRMGQAVQVFKDGLVRAAELEVQKAADASAKEARQRALEKVVAELLAGVGTIVGELKTSAASMAQSSDVMAGTVGRVSDATAAVAAATEEASSSVQSVATAIEELTATSQEIARRVSESATVVSQATEQVRRTSETMDMLNSAATKIGEVVTLISSIAGQTNLLALNATIEAARAGEAGKGFAVVASEVKALATQTAKATEEIGQQVAQVQSATTDAANSIAGVVATIERVNDISGSIAAAVEQQGAATKEIAHNVAQAAAGTREVSSNVAAISGEIAQVRDGAGSVHTAAESLNGQSRDLDQTINGFAVKIRAA